MLFLPLFTYSLVLTVITEAPSRVKHTPCDHSELVIV